MTRPFPGRSRRLLGLACVLVLLGLAVLPHADPRTVDLDAVLAGPGAGHPLGTDHLGRDLWARLATGLDRTLLVVVVAGAIAAGVGVTLGMLAGYLGGIVRWAALGLADLVMVVPTLVAALIVAAFLGLTPITAGVALGVFGIGPFVHQTQLLVREVRTRPYVEVERLMGTGTGRVLVRHVLPAVLPPVGAYLGATAAGAVLAYSALAFIGLGVDTTVPDWGSMLYEYRVYALDHPPLVLLPTLAVLVLATVCHLLADRGPERRPARLSTRAAAWLSAR